jgi:hypothetical protein
MVEQSAARVGQFDAARLATEQLDIKLPFDCPDLLAERRLLHAEALGGPGDVPFLRDCNEIPEVPQLHCHIRNI